MTARPWVQRLAEYLITRACRRLPGDLAEDRYREWAAELPAILDDPEIRSGLRRAVRALSYAAGISRSTRRAAPRPRQHDRRRSGSPGFRITGANEAAVRVMKGLGIYVCLAVLIITLFRVLQPHSVWPLVPGMLTAAGFAAFCLADLARAREARYLPKWAWAAICMCSIPLGGIMYLTVGRIRRGHHTPSGQAPPA